LIAKIITAASIANMANTIISSTRVKEYLFVFEIDFVFMDIFKI